MKKLLGLFVAFAMALPASAALVDNVDAIGRIDVIGADANRGPVSASAGSRVVAGLSADLTEDVKANVQFWYATAWDGALSGNSLNKYQDEIHLAEANVVLSNLFDCFELTLGRQFYGDEDSMTMYFGPKSGYMAAIAAQPLSLEAAKLTYADDFKSVTLLAGKTADDLALTTKYNIYGADIRMNLTDTMKAQVYGYALKDETNAPEYHGFYGAKLAYMPEAFQKGLVSEYGAYAPGLVAGKYLTPLGNTSDVIDNARIFNVGVDYKWNKMVFALDGFAFQDRTAQAAATLEADLTATYQHNESVELFAGIGYAKLGGDLKDQFASQDATVYQLGTTIRF